MPHLDLPMIIPQPPPERLAAHYAVFAQYGNTMFMVQNFEHALAILVAVAETAEELKSADPDRRLSRKQLERYLRNQTRRIDHLHHKATAAELRNEVRKHIIDQDPLDEIEPLIEWRSFLAHRYLLARLADRRSNALNLGQDHLDELADLARAFNAAVERINAKAGEVAGSAKRLPGGEHEQAAGGLQTLVAALLESRATAQPPRFKPGGRS